MTYQAPSQTFEKRLLASSLLAVFLSVCPRAANRIPLDGFSRYLIFVCLFENIILAIDQLNAQILLL